MPIYGEHVSDFEAFCYQLNCTIPFGFRIRPDVHALYDILLNFTTEPSHRYIIWNDAQYLLNVNKRDFIDITRTMISTAYINRNGLGTIKEDGEWYTVNQKNIFIFYKIDLEEVEFLINKKYYIPSIRIGSGDKLLDFEVFRIV